MFPLVSRWTRALQTFVLASSVASLVSAAPAGGHLRHALQIALERQGAAVEGPVDLEIRAFATAGGGLPLATARFPSVVFAGGLGAVAVDSTQWAGRTDLWIEVAIAVAGEGTYTTLQPRLRLYAAPVAVVGTRVAPASVGAAAIDADEVQRRVLPCGASTPRLYSIAGTGAANCAPDATGVTGVDAGPGLQVAPVGATIRVDVDLTAAQQRIATGCPEGSSVGRVAADGSVECRIDSRTRGSAMVNVQGSCAISGLAGSAARCVAQAVCPSAQPVPLSAAYEHRCLGATPMSLRMIETPQGIGYASEIHKPADVDCGAPTATHTVVVVCSPGG